MDYLEHSIGKGSKSSAVCYIEIKSSIGEFVWGVGIDENIEYAALRSLFSAINRLIGIS